MLYHLFFIFCLFLLLFFSLSFGHGVNLVIVNNWSWGVVRINFSTGILSLLYVCMYKSSFATK